MTRLILVSLMAGALVVACGGAGPGGSPGIPTVPAGGGAAQAELCSPSGDASLTGLADQLDGVDAGTDTAQLQIALGRVTANLSAVNVSGDLTTARDAALSALQQVQGALADPTTLPEVASSAVGALRQLESALCP